MSKSLRLSEKWFRRGLWLVAAVFAAFLIGLGGTIVGDLPKVGPTLDIEDFIDLRQAAPLRASLKQNEIVEERARESFDQARLKLAAAEQASRTARESFGNWISTRQATAQPGQDAELIERTRALDALKRTEEKAQLAVEAQQQMGLDAHQAGNGARR